MLNEHCKTCWFNIPKHHQRHRPQRRNHRHAFAHWQGVETAINWRSVSTMWGPPRLWFWLKIAKCYHQPLCPPCIPHLWCFPRSSKLFFRRPSHTMATQAERKERWKEKQGTEITDEEVARVSVDFRNISDSAKAYAGAALRAMPQQPGSFSHEWWDELSDEDQGTVLAWLVIEPLGTSKKASTINHNYWSYVHQFSYLGGLTF